jgi:Ni/Fe-hydrogenase 1 B-type cytochrome subunit
MSTEALRFAPTAPARSDLVRVYVWELPVRLTHWLIALSIVVLAATGFYIGSPFPGGGGPATGRFVMGTVKVVHFYAAIVFTLAVLSRVLWMFLGNVYARWNAFVPAKRGRIAGLVPTFLFYTFLKPYPPGFVGHNPLAGATYLAVFALYFVEILTGLALYSASAPTGSPLNLFDFLAPLAGGLQMMRWVHHVAMWLLLGFAVHHVYSAALMSIVEKNGTMESIFSGYKFVPRSELVRTPEGLVDRKEIRA